jgi:hypothetical protein
MRFNKKILLSTFEAIKVLPPMHAGYDGDTIVSKEKEYAIRKSAEQCPSDISIHYGKHGGVAGNGCDTTFNGAKKLSSKTGTLFLVPFSSSCHIGRRL